MGWAFNQGDSEREWRWVLNDDDTGIMVKRSETAFPTLPACVHNAIAHGYVPPPDRLGLTASE